MIWGVQRFLWRKKLSNFVAWTFRLAKYIAAYIIVPLNGTVDALVFTGGIGENSNIKVPIEYFSNDRK